MMRKMKKFTFKKYPRPTGLASVGFKRGGDIKLQKRACGFYREKEWGQFEIWFAVKCQEAHCGWKNIRLNKQIAGEAECRAWIQENTEKILKVHDLHFYDE